MSSISCGQNTITYMTFAPSELAAISQLLLYQIQVPLKQPDALIDWAEFVYGVHPIRRGMQRESVFSEKPGVEQGDNRVVTHEQNVFHQLVTAPTLSCTSFASKTAIARRKPLHNEDLRAYRDSTGSVKSQIGFCWPAGP